MGTLAAAIFPVIVFHLGIDRFYPCILLINPGSVPQVAVGLRKLSWCSYAKLARNSQKRYHKVRKGSILVVNCIIGI